MGAERTVRGANLVDVLDRVLDKGIVIDATVCVGLLGIEHVIDIDARVVVASIDTYLQYADSLVVAGSVAHPVRIPAAVTPNRNAGFSDTDSIRARGLGVRLNSR